MVNAYIDAVAEPLEKVVRQLETENLKYVVSYTRPKREYNGLDRNSLFVIRQRIDADGVYNLTVAAKLR